MSENHYDFCIKSPKWQRNTFFGFLAFGGIGSIVITVLWLIFSFDWGIWLVALLGSRRIACKQLFFVFIDNIFIVNKF